MSPTFAPRVGFDWRGFITPAVKLLVLICAGVFLVQTLVAILFPPYATAWLNHWFGLVPLGPIPGLRLWQPVTYIFLHGGLWHLLINMLMLWMFGRELELVWGKKRFLNSAAMGAPAGGHSDDRCLRGDFWNPDCECDSVSRPPHLAFSASADNSNAAVCRGYGCN